MTEKDFKEYVSQLKSDALDCNDVVFIHGVIGIASEAGELVDILKKHMVYHKPLDEAHVKEELGDLLHYMTYLLNTFGWSLAEIMETNVKKLKQRYPNGYSDKKALERKDKHETV